MQPTQLLRKQHREVEGLFRKAERATGRDERRRLMEQIADRLELHTRIEEDLFYPAVRALDTKKAREMVDEAFEEHHVVKLVLEQLPRVDPEDERFRAKMTVLKELVEHHVEEEETSMFKLADKLDGDERRDLAERMTAMVEAHGGQARAA
jgi:iron-sulfur cluster repair protein YtfE (RIC family)